MSCPGAVCLFLLRAFSNSGKLKGSFIVRCKVSSYMVDMSNLTDDFSFSPFSSLRKNFGEKASAFSLSFVIFLSSIIKSGICLLFVGRPLMRLMQAHNFDSFVYLSIF